MSLGAFLWSYARRYLAWGVLALAAILVYGAATTAMVTLFEPIFGEVLLARDQAPDLLKTATSLGESKVKPEDPGWKQALARINLKRILEGGYERLKRHFAVGPDAVVFFVPLVFLAVFLLRSGADFASGYAFQRMGFGLTADIRNDLYDHILGQSSRFHAEHPSGELVARVINDVSLMQNAVSNRLLDLFQQTLTLLLLLALLVSSQPRLALLCLVVAPMLLLPIVRFGKGLRRTSHRSQERLADLTALLSEAVRGHRVVKAFGMERFEHTRFAASNARHLRVSLRAQLLANLSGPVVESMGVVLAAVLLIWAGFAIRQGQLDAPALVTFLVNLFLMYDPIRKLNKVNLVLQQALAGAQRVQDLLRLESEITERPGAQPIHTVERGIAFERVAFSYDGDGDSVLKGVDLEIRRGEVVALVGPSGGGKSTLVNLLPRFFDPTTGRVTIDSHDIRDLPIANLRSLIGIVTQETTLFNDTIRNNIAYGRADLPLEQVRQAAVAAHADEFIRQTQAGYDTLVGEGGLRLSGGQRQRLAIARALLKNAPILILDEATSQLDTESEALVQEALGNLMTGRTTLVIAHRLSTVTRADRIVVIEDGRIAESGTHEELLANNATYKRLYDLQFQG
ncbi:MAG: ABC transporter ATP-binding protein [Thermoanaerobaculia bacterium]